MQLEKRKEHLSVKSSNTMSPVTSYQQLKTYGLLNAYRSNDPYDLNDQKRKHISDAAKINPLLKGVKQRYNVDLFLQHYLK